MSSAEAGPEVPGPVVAFKLDHRPTPQGSYKAVPLKGPTGEFTGKSVFKASSAGLKAYRAALGWAARGASGGIRLDEPVAVVIRATFPQPKRGKRIGLDDTGRMWPATRSTGDVDKISRAVLDALALGQTIEDDALVVALNAVLAYEPPRPTWEGTTRVQVWPIADYMAKIDF